MTSRFKIRGYLRLWRTRRREFRTAGVPLNIASTIALHEMRCRERIAAVIGKAAAKQLELVAVHGDYFLDDPLFVLQSRLPPEDLVALVGTQGLVLPVNEYPYARVIS